MSKITKIPSEIRNFFTGKRINPAFSKFMTLLEGMRISDKDLGGKKRENCQLTNLQLFQIILILPFMAVPGFSHYAGSSISKLFGGKKGPTLFVYGQGQYRLATSSGTSPVISSRP